jgi:hypothetical protein
VSEIEVCRSVFDLGDDELLDCREADGAEPDRVERGCGDERRGKDLYQPRRLDDFCFGSWSCENGSAEGDRRRQAQLSMLSQLRAGIDVVCPVRGERSGGAMRMPMRTPHVWIAAMSGFTPRMFMTRVRL